jgi:hypothetical protein
MVIMMMNGHCFFGLRQGKASAPDEAGVDEKGEAGATATAAQGAASPPISKW